MKKMKDSGMLRSIATVLIIIGLIRWLPLGNEMMKETAIILQAIGFAMYGISIIRNKRRERKNGLAAVGLGVFMFLSFSTGLNAQQADYSKQITAFKQSFEKKSAEHLKEYISTELKFGPIPVQNTPAVLANVFARFPKLKVMEIVENKKGEARIKHEFEGLGAGESSVFFDSSGKITKIEFIENIILQELKAQQALRNSVQQPVPGELAKKHSFKKVTFPSEDGLSVTANLYEVDPDKPFILLCHQAGYNKYEYADIAPKLNEMGFNCLAIDQRSGGPFAGHKNETNEAAIQKGIKNIDMTDAEQDIRAAINYLHKKYNKKVTVWGSSYSSSLALFAAEGNKSVNAVISFSPGNYFGDQKPSIAKAIKDLKVPFFITSSKEEAKQLGALIGDIKLKENQQQFIPSSDGFHGSRALWEGQKGAEEYWTALTGFLNKVYSK
ncbi:hypothetical protein GWK08_01015 [Leptobacterium flavescens]|uniref:Dienelactone hydrolase domain-containing protein n=1 Tax=Leptobacterium flavescens TaxID=472055 RepID=A0A6P0UJ99_9FLAO|nr:dienelactone hydrolase family protein [Leptobacterium flavescens]NER12008.1 hypothetical protein [Leptobacterium flavescens]